MCSHYIKLDALWHLKKRKNIKPRWLPSSFWGSTEFLSHIKAVLRHSSRMPKGACVSFPVTIMRECFERFKHIAFPCLELLAWNPCSLWRPPRTTCCMHLAYGKHDGQLLVLAALLIHHSIVWVLSVLTVYLCLHSFSYEDTRHWPGREPTLLHRTELCPNCPFLYDSYQGLGLQVSFWKCTSIHSSTYSAQKDTALWCPLQELNPIKSDCSIESVSISLGFSLNSSWSNRHVSSFLHDVCVCYWELTEGLTYAKHVLCHWGTYPLFLITFLFQNTISLSFPGWFRTFDPPASVFWATRVSATCHS